MKKIFVRLAVGANLLVASVWPGAVVMAQMHDYRTVYTLDHSDSRPVLVRLVDGLAAARNRGDFAGLTLLMSEEKFGPTCGSDAGENQKIAALVEEVFTLASAQADSGKIITIKGLVGRFYVAQGKFGQAEKIYRQAYMVMKGHKSWYANDGSCGTALGLLCLKRGDLSDAEQIYEEVCWPFAKLSGAKKELRFRTNMSDMAVRTGEALFASRLGMAYQAKGNNIEALKKYDDMLAFQTYVLDNDYPSAYASIRPIQKSTSTLTTAYPVKKLFFDPIVGTFPFTEEIVSPFIAFAVAHPELVSPVRLEKIRTQLKDVVAFRRSQQSMDQNFSIQMREQSLFTQLRKPAQMARALAELKEEIAVRRKKNGDDPLLSDSINLIGYQLMLVGLYADSEKFMREAIDLREKQGFLARFALGNSLSNLGALLVDEGRLSEAKPLVERALKLRADDPIDQYGVAKTQVVEARILAAQNNYAGAEKLIDSALAWLAKRDPQIGKLTVAQIRLRGARDIRPVFRQNMVAAAAQTGAEIYHTQALVELAAVYLQQKKYDAARNLLQPHAGSVASSPIDFSSLGSSYAGLFLQARIFEKLGRIECATGNLEQAAIWLDKARQEVNATDATAMAAVDIFEATGDLKIKERQIDEARAAYEEAADRLAKMVSPSNTRLAKLRAMSRD